MYSETAKPWTSVKLYNIYTGFCDVHHALYTRRQLTDRLQKHFGSELLQMQIPGCATIIFFRAYLPEHIHLEEAGDNEEYAMTQIKEKIKKEARNITFNNDAYDIGNFRKSQFISDTCPTLLKLISDLVSGRKVTQKSLSLAQSVQSHITHSPNQTTLGLAIKLHHKFGSKEVITIMHDNGYLSTYDEVQIFKHSVAIYIGKKNHCAGQLNTGGGEIGRSYVGIEYEDIVKRDEVIANALAMYSQLPIW